jgi:hypothetical protein
MDSEPVDKEREQKRIIDIFERAFGEFNHEGKVSTVKCHICGGLIEIKSLSASAWQMTCPCGKFNGSLRGL